MNIADCCASTIYIVKGIMINIATKQNPATATRIIPSVFHVFESAGFLCFFFELITKQAIARPT